MDNNKNQIFEINNCDWVVELHEVDGLKVNNVKLHRKNDKNFHATMVDDNIVDKKTGNIINFRQLMLFEHDQGKDRVGDAVILFRQNPKNSRYEIQFEDENVFLDEITIVKKKKSFRSSVDNIEKAVDRPVVWSGDIYSNPRRAGGKSIKTHYVFAGWSPQLKTEMLDVYDYVQSLDAIGLASFLKALQHMPEEPAKVIFEQMRMPAIKKK